MSQSQPEPRGVLPVLPSADVAESLAYYTETLGFTEVFRQPGDDGAILNGQVAFGDGQLMFNRNPTDAAKCGGGVYLWFRLHDDDIDALFERYRRAGVRVVETIGDRFWGDRSFTVCDHAGFHLAFHKALAGTSDA